MAGAGLARLLLAMLGVLEGLGAGLLSASVGLVCAVATFRAVAGRSSSAGTGSRTQELGAVLAVLVAVLAACWGGYAASNHVLIDRDPGSYVTTAKWIERTGQLTVEEPTAAFGDADGIEVSSAAVYQVDSGDLEFQFMHLPSAMAATGAEIGGDKLLFATGALVAAAALLPLYGVAVRFTGAPLAGVGAIAIVAFCMPFVNMARDLYSEPFAMLFLWSGILALSVAWDSRSTAAWVIGGALVGCTALARVDGYLLVSLFFIVCGAAVMFSEDVGLAGARRRAGLAALAAFGTACVAAIDLFAFSGDYPRNLRSQLLQSLTMMVAAGLVGIAAATLGPRLRSKWALRVRTRRVAGAVCGIAVGAALLAAWLIRPRVQEARGESQLWGLIGNLQVAEGAERDLFRRYSEQSVEWMAWYLGPLTLALAIAGLSVLASIVWVRRVPIAGILSAVFLLFAGAIYWWSPRNTPDHIWVMRRYMPVILPGLAVFAVFAVVYGASKLPIQWRRPVVAAASLAMVLSAALPTLQLWSMREQHGFDAVLTSLCEQLPDDASVVVVGEFASQALPQSIRSWCGLPAARLGDPEPTSTMLGEIQASVTAVGRDLAVVTIDGDVARHLTSLLGAPASMTETVVAQNRLEPTVGRRPSRYMYDDEEFWTPAALQFFVW